MNVYIDAQIIKDTAGNPALAVVPCECWLKQSGIVAGQVPNEVMGFMIRDVIPPFRVWREDLGQTQIEVAERADMTQAALSQIESGEHKVRTATREKLTRAMSVSVEQLI